jgi:hypothetical protein
MTMPALWPSHPLAQALLAEAVANPPEKHGFKYAHGDHDLRYTGKIVRDLRKVRNDFLNAALRSGDASGDHSSFVRNNALTVDRAIDEARAAAGVSPDFQEGFVIARTSMRAAA